MKQKVIVLGGGLVGGPIARDLANDNMFEVTLADTDRERLDKITRGTPITAIRADLSYDKNIKGLVKDHDYVVSAVPGNIGFPTLKSVIETGKDIIDIAFSPENMFDLDALAKEKKVTAVTDIGVAPGMSNILIGHVDHLLDKTEKVVIYVGGLPRKRTRPWEYKAVFSPADVIEEYTRPARIVENGEIVIKPALSEPELISFPLIGELEAFNSDGLRSLVDTIDAPFMIEKTLRYPGHIEKIKLLSDSGFFSKETIDAGGVAVRPLDVTSRLLFPEWKLEEGEADITIMKIIVEGIKEKKKVRYEYDLFDEFDPVTGIHSMARTTGYTATMALRMIAKGLYTYKGISVPEYIGKKPECVRFILKGLKKRGINYRENMIYF